MRLDLREIIGVPGGRADFHYAPDLSGALSETVQAIKEAGAAGSVTNSAGVLTLSANVDAVLLCVCARCLAEFEYPVHKRVLATLIEGGENGENPDSYLLQGDAVDLDEIILTEFVLDLEQRLLCRPDCKGLCQRCGADLNLGPCGCKTEIDPRLAVLGQLLDKE